MRKGGIVHILAFAVLTACILTLAQAGAADVPAQPDTAQPENNQSIGDLYAVLNEVMPKPGGGEAAWVELYIDQEFQLIYLPVVVHAASGSTAFRRDHSLTSPAGLAAPAAPAPLELSGWQVSNEEGQAYTIPEALPPLPRQVFVLIYFDGTGPGNDDYDASDGLVTLHTPPGLDDIFTDSAGQVGLYRSGGLDAAHIVDFLAWGGFSESAGANAVAAGVWGSSQAASFENGFGDISQADILEPDESLGRYPGASGFGRDNWANYPPASLTPGAANPVQPVLFITPEDNARVEASNLSLAWRTSAGASAYRIQIDNGVDFASPLVDAVTAYPYYKPAPALAVGVYHWRVSPQRPGQSTTWAGPFTIEAVSSTGLSSRSPTAEKELDIANVRQNKDSYLLGLDGAPEGDPTTNTPENAWDSPAPCVTLPCADTTKYMHGNMYCVRASIRMMASWYGGALTMDRVSYYILQEWSGNTHAGTNDSNPDNDLGYNRGMYYPDEEDEGISWALNTTIVTPGGKPSFADIKVWIDADRPIMFRRPGHMMVINGYRETGGDQFIHVLDPDQPPDLERWQDYDTQTIDGYWVGPASGTARRDEASVSTDSDGDGITDFDEASRFFTSPSDADSDDDWVPDKQDMREYVFDSSGNYSYRGSDWDTDSARKELDADNDADGTPEGCEDTNYNGKYDPVMGETDNFNAGSSQACVPHFELLYPLQSVPENAGDHTDPDKILVQVSTAVPAGWPLALTAGDFSVDIGGSGGSVLSLYPSADTHFLVVDPPVQSAANYYDLSVNLAGAGSDSEADAVFYLPKAPNDEVIVLDRSGSMFADDKIGAAKNAASAFVDFLDDGDMVGVASFATSASTDFPLTEITAGSTVRDDAIAAINGLAATGTTALGQGAQQGYSLLTADGKPDDDWSLVLLSDGWENVAPYWTDVEAGITDAVVHTVALGEDADKALLQSIAGAKHGNYFYVDVGTPVQAGGEGVNAPPLDVADMLPNRLADVYLAIGELTHGYQRLFNQSGVAQKSTQVSLNIPKGLPEVIFSLNWDTLDGSLDLQLFPGGVQQPIEPDEVYAGATHYLARVKNPVEGPWRVNIRVLNPAQEYQFMVSARSDTTLLAAVGGDPAERTVGAKVPIYGILTDFAPIKSAVVSALVSGPGLITPPAGEGVNGSVIIQLYDDGAHGDGKADDGLYANDLTGITRPGGYTVKLVAEGNNNSGETFLRYANTGFNVLRRVAYIWKDDIGTRLAYEKLLADHHFAIRSVQVDSVAGQNFSHDDLIIIGPDTGYTSEWGTPQAVSAIIQSERPVLGLGEGGYAYFGQIKLFIGYPNGWHGDGTNIEAVSLSDVIWQSPYNIALPKPAYLQLYTKDSSRVEISTDNPPVGLLVLGYSDVDRTHADLLLQSSRFILWGFDDDPGKMTDTGRRLFINAVYRTME